MPRMKKHLLLIDPQNGFAEVVGDPTDPVKAYVEQQAAMSGELCVPGGWDALATLAKAVEEDPDALDDWTITLDCHQEMHVAHGNMYMVPQGVDKFVPIGGRDHWIWDEEPFLRNAAMHTPAPLTTLSMTPDHQIRLGVYDDVGTVHDICAVTPSLGGFKPWLDFYLPELVAGGRYPHMIWSKHCRIGTPSNVIIDPVRAAIQAWVRRGGGIVNYVSKGSNFKVEHFGAVHAEVQDPEDPESTGVNSNFVKLVSDPDQLIGLAGLASTHCVPNTGRDLGTQFPDPKDFFGRLVWLKDCVAPIAPLIHLEKAFLDYARPLGMQEMTIKEFLAA